MSVRTLRTNTDNAFEGNQSHDTDEDEEKISW